MDWLSVSRGDQPLIVSIPHSGTEIPPEIEARLVSIERARVDADWWVHRLYGFQSIFLYRILIVVIKPGLCPVYDTYNFIVIQIIRQRTTC